MAGPDADEGPGVVTVDGMTPPVLSVSLDTVEAPGALATLPGQSQVPTTFQVWSLTQLYSVNFSQIKDQSKKGRF